MQRKSYWLSQGNFIGGVIFSLLNGKADLEVIEIEPQDVTSLTKAVQHYKPETVVLEDFNTRHLSRYAPGSFANFRGVSGCGGEYKLE